MRSISEFGIRMRWLWLAVGLIVAAPVPTLAAYVIPGTCSYLDFRFFAGPAFALLLSGAAVLIGVAGLRSRVSAPGIVLVVIGTLEFAAFAFAAVDLGLCIPAAP
jgi:hypothetical protein